MYASTFSRLVELKVKKIKELASEVASSSRAKEAAQEIRKECDEILSLVPKLPNHSRAPLAGRKTSPRRL